SGATLALHDGEYEIPSALEISWGAGGPGVLQIMPDAVLRKTGAGISGMNGVFDNRGTFIVEGGEFYAGVPAQWVDGVLTGGTWIVDGGALAFQLPVHTIGPAASVTLGGSGAFAALTQHLHTIQGELSLEDGYQLTTTGALTNEGDLTVADGSQLVVSGNYQQSASGALRI